MMDFSKDLQTKLCALGIPGALIDTKKSVFYTDYVIQFNENITINKVKARKNDISLFLGCNVSIIPDMASGCILFRIDNTTRDNVYLCDFQQDIIDDNTRELPIACGMDDNGKKLVIDLAKCPHLLIAGATGSGKSVFLHDVILSLIFKNKVALTLIDIKQIEFSLYDGLPCQYNQKAFTSSKQAADVLDFLCDKMDERYKKMRLLGCRDFVDFMKKSNQKELYNIVVIDELNDLLLSGNKREILASLTRLTQLGRAAGFHVVVATQRPDATVIDGVIKNNIPSRVCFAVPGAVNSRIVLDTTGAETLRGSGDGLFLLPTMDAPQRFQAAYISTKYIIDFVEKIK